MSIRLDQTTPYARFERNRRHKMVENGRASKFVEDAQRKQSFINTEMGSKKYTELLQDVVITFMENNVETELIFQQINSTIHVSKEAKE